MSKQYGLILPGNKNEKPTPLFQASRNVFGDDSDSDEDAVKKKPMLRPATNVKKQVIIAQEKALKEDPTVYQYDELYDDMEHKKKVEKTVTKEDKKPKYIEKLIESANKRKREHDRRLERQVQKEREKEGSEFADKESFVTSAYKKKLEELRAEEEREKREEYLENIGDVTKQKDLGGFYRHLYEQKLGAEPKVKEEIKKTPKKEHKDHNIEEDIMTERTEPESKHDKTPQSPATKRNRNYRKRKEMAAHDLSEGEIVSEEEDKLPTLEDIKAIKKTRLTATQNIDADSDFSDDSTDSDKPSKKKKVRKENEEIDRLKEDKGRENKGKTKEEFKAPLEKSSEPIEKVVEAKSSPTIPAKENDEPKDPPKPKINIWEKRTVGVVFEEALKRYYERKAARSR